MSRPGRENQGTGPWSGSLPASPAEKDQTATKRVESILVPCLDEGSTPSSSTSMNVDFTQNPESQSDSGFCIFRRVGKKQRFWALFGCKIANTFAGRQLLAILHHIVV